MAASVVPRPTVGVVLLDNRGAGSRDNKGDWLAIWRAEARVILGSISKDTRNAVWGARNRSGHHAMYHAMYDIEKSYRGLCCIP